MLPQILYVLQEAGTTVSLKDIITGVDKLGVGKWKSKDDCTRSLAVVHALDQGMELGFIVSGPKRHTYKLGVNYLRYENYHFNNKLRMLSEDFALHGLNKILANMEHIYQSDISDDDSTEYGDAVSYDSDDERTPTPKKKVARKDGNVAKQRKKRTFAAGATPKKFPGRSMYNKR
ncbi:uncharacterized protein LOC128303625 [Anopheles moucheti]|uniref:uncharacterized protein LOC128303625 n=1 Tax=Anopheles moucheti TaxID=186751 RepID=UPI0022F1034A|nr:uncharacterized protein LOC128303625 [Anopheles moucheti]